jgi:hypothetical protein
MLFPQTTQFDHCRIAVGDRDGVGDKAALANFEF